MVFCYVKLTSLFLQQGAQLALNICMTINASVVLASLVPKHISPSKLWNTFLIVSHMQ